MVTVETYLARQPIFDLKGNVYGYEILYRDGNCDHYRENDDEFATGSALSGAFIDFGITELTNRKKAFVNFTGDFIKNGTATIFPSECLVVEILENIEIDNEIVENCMKLRAMGYGIALDDFVYRPEYDPLLELASIVKIDFRLTSVDQRSEVVRRFRRPGLTFLAEKVETREEYREAVQEGFTLFQGYYFAQPVIGSRKKMTPLRQNRIRMIQMLDRPDAQFDELAALVESDPSFAYEVLRLVNSAYYGRISEIKSIRFALVYMGMQEVRKWLSLAFISDLRGDLPEEITTLCMIRGRFLENLAVAAGRREKAPELVTIGIFSMLDVLLGKSMAQALAELNLSMEIRSVLEGRAIGGFDVTCWKIVLEYERGRWDMAEALSAKIGISARQLRHCYLEAVSACSLTDDRD